MSVSTDNLKDHLKVWKAIKYVSSNENVHNLPYVFKDSVAVYRTPLNCFSEHSVSSGRL